MAPVLVSPPASPMPLSERSPPNTPTTSAGGVEEIHEVWAWNLEQEFGNLLAAATGDASGGAILALDMEFPGFLRQEPRTGARAARYQALRENVDRLRPIQLGAAVAGADGNIRGVWSFNLQFDVDVDAQNPSSVAFLRAAGIDFPRHREEGIESATLGRRLASSVLVGQSGRAPWWVTFSGAYDLGYLLKMLTSGRPLPRDFSAFDCALGAFCPKRHELREELPHGSLDNLAKKLGVQRYGTAHTAGSDALLTLELFLRVVPVKGRWTSWGPPQNNHMTSWEPQADPWYHNHHHHHHQHQHSWDMAANWEVARWETNPWAFSPYQTHVPAPPWPQAPVSPAPPPIPSLNGGNPMPSAAFWNSANVAPKAFVGFPDKRKMSSVDI